MIPVKRMYLPTPLHEQEVTQGQFVKGSFTGLKSEFSFSKTGCHTKAKEPSLLYFLSIAGKKLLGFMLLPGILALCEMCTDLFRI